MTTVSAVGQRLPLIEGKAKVTGKIRYIADLQLPGMLHARLLTSPHAHARLLSIDTSEALRLPGVVAILTAQDLPPVEPVSRQRLLLARNRVIFAGQPVALILAETEAAAQDALDEIRVEYEPLRAAITLDEALAEDAPLVWPGGTPGKSEEAAAHGLAVDDEAGKAQKASNIAKRIRFERGDIAAGFAEAELVIERCFTLPMVHQSPLETHGCAVQIDSLTDEVIVWSSTQALFSVRQAVAGILNRTESDVRALSTPVGGGFGGKGVLYEPLLALAVQLVGRPIRLILSRYEELVTTNPAPPGRIRLKLGAKKDGAFTALEIEAAFNSGCYPGAPVGNAVSVTGSLYRIPNVQAEGLDVLSFKPSAGAYRAPGVPQGMFALESVVDDIARELGLDPLALRLKNAAQPGDPMIHGETWPLMGMSEVLQALQAHPAWQNRAEAQAAGRGIGVAVGGWPGGTGPASAACMLNRDGLLHVQLGSVDISGVNTTFTLLAAEAFGVSPDKVKIITGDTQTSLFGLNSGGSKITYTVGPALLQAVREARQQTLTIAAELMEADPADLEIVDGKVQVKGVPDRALSLGEIAGKTMQFGGQFPPIFGRGSHTVTKRSPGFCAQLAEIEVDRETGHVQLHKLVVVQDVGRALNPLLVEGQMMGGASQGIGWALYEAMLYDEQGQPVTASWMDYTVPHIHQVAKAIETVMVEVPSDYGPLGAKGVGEPPVTCTAAAIGNAIADAAGVRLTALPMTPPRVLTALANGTGEG